MSFVLIFNRLGVVYVYQPPLSEALYSQSIP
jgi:hypothetical protein